MDQFEENPVKKLQDQVAKTLPGLSHSEIATSDATVCAPALDPLASAIVDISAHFGRSHVAETLTAGLPLVNGRLPLEHGDEAAARADLLFTLESGSPLKLQATDLPVIIFTTENEPEILWAISREKNKQQATATISLPGSPQRINVPQADVAKVAAKKYIRLRPAKGHDTRSDDAVAKSETGWFLSAFKDSRRIYAEAIAATLAVNVLALAMPLFSMNVYDRVLPNAAETTLWALAIGVGIAILFDFLIRTLRATAVDAASRRADSKLSALIFGRLLGAKQSTQPASTGVRANTLREFETLRDFLNSATLTAFGDLPFLALFLVVLWVVAGPLVWIVLASIPILLGVGYLTQRALGKLI
ncbi:MAG: ABC transporter transmembrane domain-containing protein, partial [Pseudomonadota bacterium]